MPTDILQEEEPVNCLITLSTERAVGDDSSSYLSGLSPHLHHCSMVFNDNSSTIYDRYDINLSLIHI